jgi:predicted dehydrogenase
MTDRIRLQLLGDGRLAQSLRTHAAPIGRVQLVTTQAEAVLVDLPVPERPGIVAEALRRNAIVLCPPPVVRNEAEFQMVRAASREGGRLISAGEIVHSESGRRAIEAVGAPAFGPLRSLYLAIRQNRRPGDVLADLLPEAIDAVLSFTEGNFTAARVNTGTLFGNDRDAAVILLRHETGAVVTLDLARCLPATLPAPGLGEVEIDAMGAHQSVRATIGTSAVRVYRDERVEAVPWLNAPAVNLLRSLEAVVDGAQPYAASQAERAFAVAERIRAAA